MARRPTSPAGNSRAPAGYTLVELLVVLLVLVVVSAIALPRLERALPALAAQRTARDLALLLQEAQRKALVRGRPLSVTIDPAARLVRGADGEALALAPSLGVEVTTAAVAGSMAGPAPISFFPDGTSTGGRIVLAYGARRTAVTVDWFSGRASVEPQ
jgi:general secretion pathway protein H